ncbi:MAG: hypothetical protein HYX59_10105 [Elusimicrobia bacterium]|nr:hypothetical protein [Elusimicrobiota bacterium]
MELVPGHHLFLDVAADVGQLRGVMGQGDGDGAEQVVDLRPEYRELGLHVRFRREVHLELRREVGQIGLSREGAQIGLGGEAAKV